MLVYANNRRAVDATCRAEMVGDESAGDSTSLDLQYKQELPVWTVVIKAFTLAGVKSRKALSLSKVAE